MASTLESQAAWQEVSGKISDGYKAAGNGKKTRDELAFEKLKRADTLAQASLQAKDFYTRYPHDPNAGQARKMEILMLLDSARLGRGLAEAPAIALARAYRSDKTYLREHRFEVALAADRVQLSKKLGNKPLHESPVDYEKLADDLRKEFGSIPEVYGLYTGIAKAVDMESSNRIATKVLEMNPPAFAKAEAEAITARYGLVGRPLSLRLTLTDGGRLELPTSLATNGPTVLYIWTAAPGETGNPFAELSAHAPKAASNVRWIYVGYAMTPAQANTMKKNAPFAGLHCSDDAGPQSALAQRLKVKVAPMVFVVNQNGVLTGFGRVHDLPALLSKANR